MFLVFTHDLEDFGIGILLLKLAKSLKTTRVDTAKLKGGKGKFILSLAGALDNLASLVLGKIERVADLDGLALEVLAISGHEKAFIGVQCINGCLEH
jgi:hypothetical protein